MPAYIVEMRSVKGIPGLVSDLNSGLSPQTQETPDADERKLKVCEGLAKLFGGSCLSGQAHRQFLDLALQARLAAAHAARQRELLPPLVA